MTTYTITWTLSDGRTATATVRLEHVLDRIGTNEWTGKPIIKDRGYELRVIGEVEGRVYGQWMSKGCRLDGYGAVIGKLAVPDAQVAEIDAAIARLKQSPEWQEQEARWAEHAAEMDDYDAHTRRMGRIMRD